MGPGSPALLGGKHVAVSWNNLSINWHNSELLGIHWITMLCSNYFDIPIFAAKWNIMNSCEHVGTQCFVANILNHGAMFQSRWNYDICDNVEHNEQL